MLTMREKQKLSAVIKNRYKKAAKREKTQILDEFVANTGYNRSYARRVLGQGKLRARKKHYSPRKRIYDLEVFYALRTLWVVADGICGQRLKPFIPELIRILEGKKEIKLTKTVREKLSKIGSATIDRMLSATKTSYQLKGRSTTKPGTLLRREIPVRAFADWEETKPGFFETDLVAFCGESPRGDYVNGLNLTDVATGWIGLEAVMGKAQSRVHTAIDAVRSRLPFSLLGLDPDNGTEFINWLLKRYCDSHNITFTRIRPYRKNDNCYVEQKNYTVLRRFLGYSRYETDEQLEIIKEILKRVELYVNFFQPNLKLKEKTRLGARVKKKYDTAKTPYQRLVASKLLTEEQSFRLQDLYESLNPMQLRREINKLTARLNNTLSADRRALRYKIRDLTKQDFRYIIS